MSTKQQDPAIRGKTIRMRWTEGPTKGNTHEHIFHEDGTVEWHDAATRPTVDDRSSPGSARPERPRYAALEAAKGIYVVSYLAPSGYTLTVVLNFQNHRIIGFASSSKDWHPVQGTFEVV